MLVAKSGFYFISFFLLIPSLMSIRKKTVTQMLSKETFGGRTFMEQAESENCFFSRPLIKGAMRKDLARKVLI